MADQAVITFASLSETQQKLLRYLSSLDYGQHQVAGYGAAPFLSAAHALVRKGFLGDGYRTGTFVVTDTGRHAVWDEDGNDG